VSLENQYFVLHDSQGFEPGDLSNFDTVRGFIQQRSHEDLPMKDRIHGLWFVHFLWSAASLIVIRLCVETPTAGGRVFEKGDEYLLQFAHEIQRALLTSFYCISICDHHFQFPLCSSSRSTTDWYGQRKMS
jgi:hypothetical protein